MMEFLSVSRTTLYRWVKEGTIPNVRVGKKIFVRESTIEAWLESKERGTKAGGGKKRPGPPRS
jgi:excisionase family DNA binding protein